MTDQNRWPICHGIKYPIYFSEHSIAKQWQFPLATTLFDVQVAREGANWLQADYSQYLECWVRYTNVALFAVSMLKLCEGI